MPPVRCISIGVTLLLLAAGCAAERGGGAGANVAAPSFRPWSYNGKSGHIVQTEHYIIHSTIEDRDFLALLGNVMEGALDQYRQFTPGVRISARPMECYVFAYRPEWAHFTRERTGSDATVYLQINRGGYTVRDWYVAYFIGDIGTCAVAAHEGWHQFVARHFRSRLPPFLEEGIATMFETITWSNGKPRWHLAVNYNRAEKLRHAIDDESLWPLEKLITMHAGDVVGMTGERIETFYAQNWAFAQFLWEAGDRRHRPALQRMLADLASGNSPPGISLRRASSDLWDPSSAKPLLEHYLGMKLDEIDSAYQAYVRRIAIDRRRQQVQSSAHNHDS